MPEPMDSLIKEHYKVKARSIVSLTTFEVSLLAVLKEIVNGLKKIEDELVYIRGSL